MWREYLFAPSVDEALRILAEHRGEARLIAGGTDLVLQCQRGECPARAVVDITRIPGLHDITEQDGWVVLGAAVTHAQAAASPVLRNKGRILADACRVVGGPQIRSAGTVVGNLITALPAADAALALIALHAEAEVVSAGGRAWLPLVGFHEGIRRCRVDPCQQMVVHLRFRGLSQEHRCAQERLARRKVHALPVMNVAVVGTVREGAFADMRIAVGPVATRPLRVWEVEAFLEGQPAEAAVVREAATRAATLCHPRDSLLRGSGEYRRQLVGVMVRRALERIAGLAC